MKKSRSILAASLFVGSLAFTLFTMQESKAQCCSTWQEYSCPKGGSGCGDGDSFSCSYHKNCSGKEDN